MHTEEYDHLNTEGYQWVNTPGYNETQVAGKPLHAVPAGSNRSLCGLRRSKWSFDFFNVDQCKRCLKSLNKRLDK